MAKKKEPDMESRETEAIKAEFTKEQLLASEKFRDKRDLISALLDDDASYPAAAVEKMIDKFMKGQVK